MSKKISKLIAVSIAIMILLIPMNVFATETTEEGNTVSDVRYYLGSPVNAGKDTGYSEKNKIEKDDPHFGWNLGSFSVGGYTRVINDNDENPVFLKTPGDKVALWFNLKQDINKLNGKEGLKISEDSDGYDEYFGVPKTNLKHGALIVKHINYQNSSGDPTIYTDYLAANTKQNADAQIDLFEEGDYEVALDYEIEDTSNKIMGIAAIPSYTNYKIYFKFSVRNGNCMVYPFDISTKAELTNTAITENGFYLDIAKSRYLDIDIKKEVLTEGADGLTEDVRFNKPAKDGEKYTDEGIYVITVNNRYTKQQTTKQIYVGKNKVMKAYVATGMSIKDINTQVEQGAKIGDDGNFISSTDATANELTKDSSNILFNNIYFWIVVACAIIVCVVVLILHKRKKSKTPKNMVNIENFDENGETELQKRGKNDD